VVVVHLSGPDDSVDQALKVLGSMAIAYHRYDRWVAVQPSRKDAALAALKESGIRAEEATF
jgi:hypothetical protein